MVDVTRAVGRKANSGPAANYPTDMMLVYFFLYRLYCTSPWNVKNKSKKVVHLLKEDPRIVNWRDPSLPTKLSEAIYACQSIPTNYLYADGRVDPMTGLFTPHQHTVYTMLLFQFNYKDDNPLNVLDYNIGGILAKDLLLPQPVRFELFGV